MKIIDFHTHPGYNTTKTFGYDMTDELFISELRRAGISKACGSALDLDLIRSDCAPETIIKKLNLTAWGYHEKFPDFFIPGIHIHPDCPDISANELENYSKKGVRLVGELVPYLMGCDTLLSSEYFELFSLCTQLNMIVSLHTTTLDECISVAESFPQLKIVLAHPGYNNDYLDRLDAVKKHENLFLDISGTGIAAYGMLRYGIDTVGKEKILFGTDFPGYSPEIYTRAVMFERLSSTETDAVFWQNAHRLLFE